MLLYIAALYFISEPFRLSEVIIHDALRIYSQRIQIICNGLDQHWRSAEIVLAILWCLVILQVGITDAVNSKALVVLHALSIFRNLQTFQWIFLKIFIFILKISSLYLQKFHMQFKYETEELKIHLCNINKLFL